MDEITAGGESGHLPPLPRRVGDPAPEPVSPTRSAEGVVSEMLERAAVLLSTLESDVAGLEADQERERERIADETQQRRAAAEVAVGTLAVLTEQAFEIEHRKGRDGVIDRALRGPAPSIEGLTFDRLEQDIGQEIRLAKGITGAIRIETIGQMLRAATACVERMIAEAEASEALLLTQTDQTLGAETVEATASFEIGTGVLERDLASLDTSLPTAALPWSDTRWEGWSPPTEPAGCVRLGDYTSPRLATLGIPALVDVPGTRGLVIEPGPRRDEAIRAVQSLLLRIVASLPPGAARFTVFDPEGLGEAIAPLLPLTESAPALLDGGVHTTEESIDKALAELTVHVERVIQRYLRGRFTTLAEAGRAAGELLEPFRFVVVVDHPRQLAPQSIERLATLAAQGPRCGVYPIVVKDPRFAPTFGGPKVIPLDGVTTITGDHDGFWVTTTNAGRWAVELDEPPGTATADSIVVGTAEEALSTRQARLDPSRAFELLRQALATGVRRSLPDSAVPLDPDDTATWWSGKSGRGIGVPLGRSGAVDLVALWLDGTLRGGALVLSANDSEVTPLLDSIIIGLAMMYPPDQLQLDLVGLGDRRDFAPEAGHALVQAQIVAMGAERELAISVLESLCRELDRRQGLDPAEAIVPRRLLVLDDPRELLATPDRRREQVSTLLERIARDGPEVGIHVIVVARDAGTEQLAGLPVDSLTTRVVLPGSDVAAAVELGADADQIAEIAQGDALVVTGSGDTAAARRVRLAHTDQRQRERCLRELRRLATEQRLSHRPQVFDGAAVARFEQSPLAQFLVNTQGRDARIMPRLWLGEPMTLGGPVEALLRRHDGSNLLVVGPDEQLGQGLLLAAATTAVLGQGRNLDVRIIDFMPLESGFAEGARALGEHWPVEIERRRQLAKVLDAVHRVVQDRGARGTYGDPPVLLLLNGLGRARELDRGVGAGGDPEVGGVDLDFVSTIEAIARSGPEVGVHTIVWAETADVLTKRLGHDVVSQFGIRVVMGIDADASTALIDSAAAGDLPEHQALLYDEDKGRLTRFRPYALPEPEWLAGLARAAAG